MGDQEDLSFDTLSEEIENQPVGLHRMKGKVLGKFCDINSDSDIGEGTVIWSWVFIGKGAIIGRRCKIGNWVQIERECVLGDDCNLQPGVILNQGMIIGNRVWFSGGVVFSDERFPQVGNQVRKATHVGDDVIFGINCSIVGGIDIGKRSVIGAGSVVIHDVPEGVVVAGNPAKKLYTREEYESRKIKWEHRGGVSYET